MFIKLESNNKIFKQLKYAETLMTNRSKSFFSKYMTNALNGIFAIL